MLVNPWPFYLGHLCALSGPISYYLTGDTWMITFVCYGLTPVLDHFLPVDYLNPSKEDQRKMHTQFKYKLPVHSSVFLEMAILFWGIYVCVNHNLTMFQLVGMIVSLGIIGAVSINISHELFHKTESKVDVLFGLAILAHLNYMHFYLEHLWGHHKNVATFEDPATSRYNESLYRFLPRSIIGGFKSSWNIERERLKAKGVTTVWSLHNIHFSYFLVYCILWTVIYKMFGLYGLVLYIVLGTTSFVYLEIINYVEHYGLLRKEISPGKYEPVDIRHSWNAPQLFSNYILLKLQRHSDHHENPKKPYQNLCSFTESPTLPAGYPLCVLMSLTPSLWFKVMNAVLKQYQEEGKHVPMKSKNVTRLMNMTMAFYFFTTLGLSLCSMGTFTGVF
mmetsp:Transcript_40690/g.46786  ORF Transcript_40690/g.46786 Transcript_40690/m.46786 type:complete len:390 (-) Transcript_40690:2980-4149(-)